MRRTFYRPRQAAGNSGFHKTLTNRNKGHAPKTPLRFLKAEASLPERLEIVLQTEKIAADFINAAREQLDNRVIALHDRHHAHPVIIAGMDNVHDMLALTAICHQHHLPVILVGREDDAFGNNGVTDLAANAAEMLQLPGLQQGFVLIHSLGKNDPPEKQGNRHEETTERGDPVRSELARGLLPRACL